MFNKIKDFFYILLLSLFAIIVPLGYYRGRKDGADKGEFAAKEKEADFYQKLDGNLNEVPAIRNRSDLTDRLRKTGL